MPRPILRVLLWVVGLGLAYGLGILVTVGLLIPMRSWAVADARALAGRIEPGMTFEEVRGVVGRAPDLSSAITRNDKGKLLVPGVDPPIQLEQWIVGGGRLIVRYDAGHVSWARGDFERWPPAYQVLLIVFLWWFGTVVGD